MTQYKYKYYVGNNRTHFVCIIKHLDDVCIWFWSTYHQRSLLFSALSSPDIIHQSHRLIKLVQYEQNQQQFIACNTKRCSLNSSVIIASSVQKARIFHLCDCVRHIYILTGCNTTVRIKIPSENWATDQWSSLPIISELGMLGYAWSALKPHPNMPNSKIVCKPDRWAVAQFSGTYN